MAQQRNVRSTKMKNTNHNLATPDNSDNLSGRSLPLSTWIIQPPTGRYAPPRIYEYEPHRGQEMEHFYINLQMDNNAECLPRLKVAFSSCIMPTQVFLDPALKRIQLTCTVPPWSSTQSDDKTINLYVIVVSDQSNEVLDAWSVGCFTYQYKKRPFTELSLDYNDMMMKHIKSHGLSSVDKDQEIKTQQLQASHYTLQQGFDYGYYGLHQPTSSTDESTLPTHNMFPHKPTDTTHSFSESMGVSSEDVDQVIKTDESSHEFVAPGVIYDMSTSPLQHPPATDMTNASATAVSVPQYQQHDPSLFRILPNPMTSTTVTATTANPFANLLSNGDLIIEGDLDDMMRQWNGQEQQDHRRLVQLWRRQQGHEIICNFQAISPTNRANTAQEIIVSCIYWENKDDYFITSVDIIYLLESLIGVRFTSEEKNRVRRNLEGFHPLTVSKSKTDSSDFFKLIMAFNHPKPRNIEKDLKVFTWLSLPTALKKIIGKYSASYSSTASVTLDPHNV